MPANPQSLKLTEVYQQKSVLLGKQTQDEVARHVSAIDPEDLPGTLKTFVNASERAVSIGQARARDLALGYFRAYIRLETGEPGEAVETLKDNVGTTADGRPIGEVLGATEARFYSDINAGVSFMDAVKRAESSARRVAQFEVHDAGVAELLHQFEASPKVNGWRSKSRGTCGGCLGQDDGGTKDPKRKRRPPYHPGCTCVPEPDIEGVESTVERQTGQERFLSLTQAEQDALIGEDAADLVTTGELSFDDLVAQQESPEWRDLIVQSSAQDLKALAGVDPEAPEIQSLVEGLIEGAAEDEKSITALMESLEDATGGTLEGLQFRLKTDDIRMGQKIVEAFREKHVTHSQAAGKIKDALRYTLSLEQETYGAGARQAIAELEKSFDVIQVKNFWLGDLDPDYRGIHVYCRNKAGRIFEFQLHTPETWALKQGESHELKNIIDGRKGLFGDKVRATERLKEIWADIVNDPPPGVEEIESI